MDKKTENFCVYWLTIFFKCMFWLYEHPFKTVALNCLFISACVITLYHEFYTATLIIAILYAVIIIMLMVVLDLEAQQRDSLRYQVFNYVHDGGS